MDSWFEFLIPIIVIILYLMNRMRGGGDELEGPPREESEADEEARRIQEEIRRKIVARQQGRETEAEPDATIYAQREPEPQHFGRYGAEPEFREPETGRFQQSTEREVPVAVPPPIGGEGGRDYQAELQEQLKRVKETKKVHQQATRKARDTARTASIASGTLGGKGFRHSAGQVQRRYRNYPVNRVQEELFSRDGLQRAFILKEVLGPPLGLRPHGDSHAELSRD